MSANSKVWFITGAARDTTALADLVETFGEAVLPIRLDVTDRLGGVAAVNAAGSTSADSTSW